LIYSSFAEKLRLLFLIIKTKSRNQMPEASCKSFTFEKIKQKLINYCVYQDRSHYEAEQKMKEFMLIPEAKDKLILYLIKENYLNEERFTRSYIRGKFYIKHWGRNKIRQHLKMKQIPEKLINKCWNEIDSEDYRKTIIKIFNDYFGTAKGKNHFEKQSKSVKYLIGRGFEYDAIMETINENIEIQ